MKIPESHPHRQRYFDVVKPCSRCILTTISPEKGQKHPSGEPLKPCSHFAPRRIKVMSTSART